jgi:hypothetical protein
MAVAEREVVRATVIKMEAAAAAVGGTVVAPAMAAVMMVEVAMAAVRASERRP